MNMDITDKKTLDTLKKPASKVANSIASFFLSFSLSSWFAGFFGVSLDVDLGLAVIPFGLGCETWLAVSGLIEFTCG